MKSHKNIPAEILQQAVEWLLKQQGEPLPEEEQQAFQQWLQQSKLHQRAWQCAEYYTATIYQLPQKQSEHILQKADQIHRNYLANIGKLILIFVLFAASYWTWQSNLYHHLTAAYMTKVGEQKQIKLDDGSQVYLNTNTALDPHFDQQQRLVALHYGEIQIKTAKDNYALKRPFLVQTKHGKLEALGTVFNVRQMPHQTCIAVIESAVKVTAYQLKSMIVKENQQLCFNQKYYHPIQDININAKLWQHGLFAAYDMPLSQFVQEMRRYHQGYMTINNEIADMRISGSFPIQDTAATLKILKQTYPVTSNDFLQGFVISLKPQ